MDAHNVDVELIFNNLKRASKKRIQGQKNESEVVMAETEEEMERGKRKWNTIKH